MSRSSALWRVLLASLVMLGTSGSSVGALMCSLRICDQSCISAMDRAGQSCCPEEQEQPKDCHCELTNAPDTTAVQATAVTLEIPQIEFHFAPAAMGEARTIEAATEKVFAFGDSSPPLVARAPDLGRAPPAA